MATQWCTLQLHGGFQELNARVQECTHSLACIHTKHVLYIISMHALFPQIYLGNYPSGSFNDQTAQRLIIRFQEQLNDISGEIHHRNKDLDMPYTYMLPKKIPNSITI